MVQEIVLGLRGPLFLKVKATMAGWVRTGHSRPPLTLAWPHSPRFSASHSQEPCGPQAGPRGCLLPDFPLLPGRQEGGRAGGILPLR